jgi:hypothetical protein
MKVERLLKYMIGEVGSRVADTSEKLEAIAYLIDRVEQLETGNIDKLLQCILKVKKIVS